VLEFNTPEASSSDRRQILYSDRMTFATQACANASLTSASGLCSPTGVAIDSLGNVFIADLDNNRVLEYNTPLTTDRVADAVLGQAVFDTGFVNLVDGKGFNEPSNVTIDPYSTPNHVYVADANFSEENNQNRVLAWYDAATFQNGQPADIVFGQPDFFHTAPNNGMASSDVGGVGPDSLESPIGMTVDSSSNLYIVDSGNDRVLEYNNPFLGFVPGTGPRITPVNTPPGSAGDSVADTVFGTCGSFTGNACNPSSGTNRL
jgi:NHL repeat